MPLRRPRLSPLWTPIPVDGEGIFMVSEQETRRLEGAAFVLLLPHLDGQQTAEALCARLAPQLSPAVFFYALAKLERSGFLIEGGGDAAPGVQAWQHLSGAIPLAVRIDDRAGGAGAVLADAVTAAGGRLDGGLQVVLVADHLQDGLEAINRAQLAAGEPWVIARLVGGQSWLGPWLVPGETGCWRCLAHRLSGARQVTGWLQSRTGIVPPPAVAATPATLTSAAGLLVSQLSLGAGSAMRSAVVSVDHASLQTRRHVLHRRPQCPACGDPGLLRTRQARPPKPDDAPAVHAGGGLRSQPTEAVLERLLPLLSPITGVVHALRSTRVADALHAYTADHNHGNLRGGLSALRLGLRQLSGGKGRTDAEAKLGALAESIERHAGVYQGDELTVTGRWDELPGRAWTPPELTGYSTQQIAQREQWRALTATAWVPEPWDPDWRIPWSPVWSLVDGAQHFVPAAWLYYRFPTAPHPEFAAADSNGCAAGVTRTEAIIQGLLELIERDAVALWWYNRVPRPRADPRLWKEPWLRSVAAQHTLQGRRVWALDLRTDLGVPCFVAISQQHAAAQEAILMGFGAHLDPQTALRRAVAELNQMLPFADALCRSSGDLTGRWLREVRLAEEPWLQPGAPSEAPEPAPIPTLRAGLDDLLSRVTRAGLHPLVADLSRPDLPLCVVKVIVPGLRHFWPRLGPGRLYDVPVALSWRDTPCAEEDLNPWPVFL